MCVGVIYQYESRVIKTYFTNPKSSLPVLMKNGSIQLLPWGRRQKQSGALPLGGWARIESIETGFWDKYFPIPVKLMVNEFFSEETATGNIKCRTITEGSFMQGLVATDRQEIRVYVVTITPTEDQIHDRWPKILTNNI
tara:strand:+ start:6963 stop:7379 length:417 start_codon:yes stop_codon:yes gene_type:complete